MPTWTTYLERHTERREIALEAAAQSPDAVVEQVVRALGLTGSAHAALVRQIHRRPPRPPASALAGLLSPADRLPRPPFDHTTDLAFRDWLCARPVRADDPRPPSALAWLCAALLGHGRDLAELSREPWGAALYPGHPHDELCREVLRSARRGDLWGVMKPLQRLTWGPCRGVFEAGARGLHLPAEVQTRAVEQMREAWPYLLVAGTEESGPDFPEILLRSVETLGGAAGPIPPVARLLGPQSWERLAADLALGRWRGPLAQLYRAPRGDQARLDAVAQAWKGGAFEADMIGVMTLRLINAWARRPETCLPAAAWRRVEAGAHRGRARLRAAASAHVDGACAALLASPHPYARLVAGTKRYAIALFWREAHLNFPGDSSASPPPPAPAPESVGALLPTAEAMGSLRAWALLAVLRGDGALVARWRDRRIGKIGGTWARRQQELPDALRNPTGLEGAHPLARLSLALHAAPELLDANGAPGAPLIPYLARVAALDGKNRKTLGRILEILREAAQPGQAPEPGGGAPSMVQEARRWLPPCGRESGGGER